MATSHASPRTRSSNLSLTAWAIILPVISFVLLGLIASLPLLISNEHSNDPGAVVLSSISEKLSRMMQLPLGIAAAPPSRHVNTKNISSTAAASFLDTVNARRSWYALDKSLPVSQEEITRIVQDAIQAVPSAFNSQTNRAVVLFGAEHDKLWDIVTEVLLESQSSEDHLVATREKMAGFKAAGGTILFLVDTAVVQSFVAKIPSRADQFLAWAVQSDAMLQHTIWTTLAADGLGANLQHYNPLIDSKVADEWALPANWRLSAQLVFGGRVGSEPAPKGKKLLEEKLKVFGSTGSGRG